MNMKEQHGVPVSVHPSGEGIAEKSRNFIVNRKRKERMATALPGFLIPNFLVCAGPEPVGCFFEHSWWAFPH